MSIAPGTALTPAGETPPAVPNGDVDLAQLRAILLGPEQSQLDALQRRLDDPDTRVEELSSLVAEAIAARAKRDRTVQYTLNPIIEEALRMSVERNPHMLASSLFPIIGEAVRKAVAHALRGMVESLNQVLERSFSWESMKWRFEALRTGKTFGEVALTHSLRYRVEQVFLIHRDTGLLLQHVATQHQVVQDTDLVSGMLTAVQDFVRDSFSGKSEEELETIQVGSYTVWLQHGPFALLAAVVTGSPPVQLRDVFARTLETIHKDYAEPMANFSGDAKPFNESADLLRKCLLGKQAPVAAEKSRMGTWLLALLAVVAIAAVGYLWDQNRRWNWYTERLRSEPGVMLTSSEKSWGSYSVVGLRDPLAADPDELLRQSGLNPDKVSSRWEPYLSLDPGFALTRKALASKEEIEKQTIRFPLDSSKIEPSEMAKIDFIQTQLNGLQQYGRSGEQNISIEISGHTDQSGDERRNVLLSQHRADEVAKALIGRGIPATILHTSGVAASDPSLRGTTQYLEDLDRRVTFRVALPVRRGKR